jgi:hypothetical protein
LGRKVKRFGDILPIIGKWRICNRNFVLFEHGQAVFMDIVDYINEVDRRNREYAKSPCPQ